MLRWNGTHWVIYKDKRILKSYYNHHFKKLKNYYICPQNAFLMQQKIEKVKPVPIDPLIVSLPFNRPSYMES